VVVPSRLCCLALLLLLLLLRVVLAVQAYRLGCLGLGQELARPACLEALAALACASA
jgi:hypothetical protein